MPKVDLTDIECWCSLPFSMPTRLLESCRKDGTTFWCPLGHGNTFKDSENDKLRRERDNLKQQMARVEDEAAQQRRLKEAAERQAIAYKGQVTKLRNRAKNGVCPCCNRSFENLQRHMATKHPDFATDEPKVA